MANEVLRIGEMAQRSSTKVETIRYYERIGRLATPVRTQGNYRVYNGWHLRRLKFIRRGRDLGFSLNEVRMGSVAERSPGKSDR